jgi:hypothetical protein
MHSKWFANSCIASGCETAWINYQSVVRGWPSARLIGSPLRRRVSTRRSLARLQTGADIVSEVMRSCDASCTAHHLIATNKGKGKVFSTHATKLCGNGSNAALILKLCTTQTWSASRTYCFTLGERRATVISQLKPIYQHLVFAVWWLLHFCTKYNTIATDLQIWTGSDRYIPLSTASNCGPKDFAYITGPARLQTS